MPKDLIYGQEARTAIIEGVDFLADAVKVTLGPKGRNVAISRRIQGLSPLVTKDGVTVANHVDPASPRHQIGSDLAREAANKCVHATGDGTTTTTVLVQGMVHAGANFIARGIDPWSMKRGIDKAAALVIEQLETIARPVENPEQTFDVANISSNGDFSIARMVCVAFHQVGIDGAVTVEESGTALTELSVTSGIQFRSGEFLSPSFANDLERFEAVYEDAYILLFEGRIGTAKSLAPLLAQVARTGKPFLCIAGDWEQDALALLVVNRLKSGAPVVAVKTGAYAERRRDLLRDIASLTGGTAILDDSGVKIESATLAHLGQAKRIVVSDKDTTIVDGYGPPEDVAARVAEIRTKLESAEGVNKLWLERRLAQLAGGIAVIKVGGNTETEMREKKDRFDDAVGATRAAIERGFVPGGGLALLKAQARVFASLKGDEQAGLTVVSQACAEPLKQIARNAGYDADAILIATMGQKGYKLPGTAFGFDAKAGEFTDLVERGVIDPAKVVIEALRNAAATAGMILTTELLDIEPKEEIEAAIAAARGMSR
jgi:chaperonin GroEL